MKSVQEHRSVNLGALFCTNMLYHRRMHCTPNIDRYFFKHGEEFFIFLHNGASNIPCDVIITLLQWNRNAQCICNFICGKGGGLLMISNITVKNSIKSLKICESQYANIYRLQYVYNWAVMLLKAYVLSLNAINCKHTDRKTWPGENVNSRRIKTRRYGLSTVLDRQMNWRAP